MRPKQDSHDGEAPGVVHDVLATSGQPLAQSTRDDMEQRFGREFGDVRIHTDATAAESAAEIGSLAYTVGNDIVFAGGHYSPSTAPGRTRR